MRRGKPFRERFEESIYQAMGKLRPGKPANIAMFIGSLKPDYNFSERQHVKFPHPAVFNMFLFMPVKRIRSQSALARYLKDHKKDAIALGFEDDKNGNFSTPSQQEISYLWRKLVSGETRVLLNDMARKIEKLAEKFGIVFDSEVMKIRKVRKHRDPRTLEVRVNRKSEEIARFLRKKIYPLILMAMHHNTKFKKKFLLDFFVVLCEEKAFAHDGFKRIARKIERIAEKYGIEIDVNRPPYLNQAWLRRIAMYASPRCIQEMFDVIYDFVCSTARKSGFLSKREKYPLSIDYHDKLHYGEYTPMTIGREYKDGTSKCYRFATSYISYEGNRFTLCALPKRRFDSHREIVEALVCDARRKIRVGRVLCDRGFFGSEVINFFDTSGLEYIMPVPQTGRIATVVKRTQVTTIYPNYEISDGKAKFNLIVVVENGKKSPFATNTELDERDVDLAANLVTMYRKRWGIETSYRVIEDMDAKTTSKNYKIRLFYFHFCTVLYNVWILGDAIAMKSLIGKITEGHLITAKMFVVIIATLSDDGDDG